LVSGLHVLTYSHLNTYIKETYFIGFEVLIAMVMESYIFWDIRPYNPFRGTDFSEEHVASWKSVDFQRSARRYVPDDITLRKLI
jgi:hypothetical protein